MSLPGLDGVPFIYYLHISAHFGPGSASSLWLESIGRYFERLVRVPDEQRVSSISSLGLANDALIFKPTNRVMRRDLLIQIALSCWGQAHLHLGVLNRIRGQRPAQ